MDQNTVGDIEGRRARSWMDVSYLLRWKRKWAIIHNTTSLKIVMRWSLLSSLLIAWYSFCSWETFKLEPLHSHTLFTDMRVYERLSSQTYSVFCYPVPLKTDINFSSYVFALFNAQLYFLFKIWTSWQWRGKATADTWVYQKSWRCEPGIMWCSSVPPVHQRYRSTPGIRMWEYFHDYNFLNIHTSIIMNVSSVTTLAQSSF